MRDIDVLKFGGSSFQDADGFRTVAAHLAARAAAGRPLVVVVSGMPGATEELRSLAQSIDADASAGTLHAVLPLADAIGAGLLGIALRRHRLRSRVLSFHQLGLTRDGGRLRCDRRALLRQLDSCQVAVMPGGQAVDGEGHLVSLGKNSSDLTAVTVAAGLGIGVCEIYSDVDGVYTADPNLISGTRLVPQVSYRDAGLLAAHGAKVLHPGAVEAAEAAGVEIHCRLNRDDFRAGTVVSRHGAAHAVVLDLRSAVVEFATDALRAWGTEAFTRQGVPAHRLAHEGRHLTAVTGGFFDVPRFLGTEGIPGRVTDERLVTVLYEGAVTYRVAAGDEAAAALAAAEHERLLAAESGRQPEAGDDSSSSTVSDVVTCATNDPRTPSSTRSSER